MHWAMLNNYLGIPQVHGSDFQKTARAQVEAFGAELLDGRVEQVVPIADGTSEVTLDDGEPLPGATPSSLRLGAAKPS